MRGEIFLIKCPKCGTENKKEARFCNDCGCMIKDELKGHGTLGRGTLLGKYYVIDLKSFELGENLYIVEDRSENCKRFIKEILAIFPDENSSLKAIERFEKEVEILRRISHPSIPVITDFFTEKGTFYLAFYLVFNFMEGEILDNIKFSDNVSEEFVRNLGVKVCNVFDFLHKNKPPVYCYNLCPSNIIIKQGNGDVFITDIPISRGIQSNTSISLPRRVEFVAPERFEFKIGPESDIYTLGVLIHYLLTGIRSTPFIFKPLRSVRPDISEDMEKTVSTALRLKPEKRFPSVSDMKKALSIKGQESKTISLNTYLLTEKKEELQGLIPKPVEDRKILPRDKVKPVFPVKPPEIKQPVPPPSDIPKIDEKIDNEMIRWYFQTGDKVSSSPIIINGTVYVGSDDKHVYAIDLESGREKWRFPTGSWVSTSPAFHNDRVYVGARDGCVYCINAFNGKKDWEFKSESSTFYNPSITQDGLVLIGSSLFEGSNYDDVLLALNGENGNKEWTIKTNGSIFHGPLIVNNIAYLGTEGGNIFALDVNKREELWSYNTEGRIYSAPVISEDIIYVTSEGFLKNGCVCLLNIDDGRYIWGMEFEKPFRSAVCVGEDIIYVSSLDKNLYAIDLIERKILWKFKTGSGIRCTPVLQENIVYIGSDDGTFYALEAHTGNELWKFQTGGALRSSPVAVEKTIVFGSRDGKIYGLNLSHDKEEKKNEQITRKELKPDVKTLPQNKISIPILFGELLSPDIIELFNRGNYSEVIDILDKIKEPGAGESILLGDACKELNLFDKAIINYDRASHLEPNSPEIYVKLGKAYSLKGDFEDAIFSYDMALEINREYIDAWFGKIQLLTIEKKYNEALELINNCEKLTSDEGHIKNLKNRKAKIFLELGKQALESNELASSINYLESAEKFPLSESNMDVLKKSKALVFFKLGETYSKNKDIKRAREFYKMCAETYPDSDIADMARNILS